MQVNSLLTYLLTYSKVVLCAGRHHIVQQQSAQAVTG